MGFGKRIVFSLLQSLIHSGCVNKTKFLQMHCWGKVLVCVWPWEVLPASLSCLSAHFERGSIPAHVGHNSIHSMVPTHPSCPYSEGLAYRIHLWLNAMLDEEDILEATFGLSKFCDWVVMSAVGWEGRVVAWMPHIWHPYHGCYLNWLCTAYPNFCKSNSILLGEELSMG